MTSQAEKGQRFAELHESGTFVMPNPWDAGSARVMAALGFQALATTSSGFAFTLGRLDGLYPVDRAAERVAAAVEAARALSFPFTLTARAENFLRGNPDLDDTIARLRAYEAAGADVLYAPRLQTVEEVRAVCEAVSKPVNVLARPNFTLTEVAAVGARRVSVGGPLTWVAVGAMAEAAVKVREGDFTSLRSDAEISEWLRPPG
jgi:2-methylisocitrate lyase-like PEP mutase family enzyme